MRHAEVRLVRIPHLMHRAGLICMALLCAAWSPAVLAQDIPDDFGPPIIKPKAVYLSPENFSTTDDYLAFREHAHEFLADHPYHVLAPRALHDLILIHGLHAKPDQNVINGLKARLAFEYPESLATTFLMKSFKDQSEYRTLLTTEFRKPDRDYSSEFCRQFLKAAELGLNQFGPPFVGEDGFQFQIRLALTEGKSFRLGQLNETHREAMKEPAKSGLELCRKPDLSPADRVTGLHRLVLAAAPTQQAQLAGIRDSERFWMSRLTEDDRQQPAILALLIEKKLELKEFDQALAMLDQLLARQQELQWLFWRGWCLANQSRTTEAIRVLESLKKQSPDNAWSGHAQELAAALRDQKQAIIEQSAALQELIGDLTVENLELLRIDARYNPANRKSFVLAANADAVHHTLDAFIHHGGLPTFGYKASLKDYYFFIKDQPEALRIAKPGSFPDLQLGFAPTPKGLTYNFHFNLLSTPEAAESWRRAVVGLLKNPLLANQEAIQAMLRQSASNNGFPLRVKTVGDHRILTWLTPEINQPKFHRLELELAGTGQQAFSVRYPECEIDFRYGKLGSLEPMTSTWDHLKIVEQKELSISEWMRAMALASTLFNPEEGQSDPEPASKSPPAAAPPSPEKSNEVQIKPKPRVIAQPPKLSSPR